MNVTMPRACNFWAPSVAYLSIHSSVSDMAKDPTKDPVFKKTLANLLSAKPKTQAEMKIGKKKKNPRPARKSSGRASKA